MTRQPQLPPTYVHTSAPPPAPACLARPSQIIVCEDKRQAACGDSPPGRSEPCAARRPHMGRRTRHVNRLIKRRGFVGSRILNLDFHQIFYDFIYGAFFCFKLLLTNVPYVMTDSIFEEFLGKMF